MSCTVELMVADSPVLHGVIPMPRDGSCLFHSLGFSLFDSTDTEQADTLRATLVEYVCRNWKDLGVFTCSESGDPFESQEEYRESMLQSTTYGAVSELKAAGVLYPVRIEVYQDGVLRGSFGKVGRPIKRLLFSGSLTAGHYDVCVPVERVLNELYASDALEQNESLNQENLHRTAWPPKRKRADEANNFTEKREKHNLSHTDLLDSVLVRKTKDIKIVRDVAIANQHGYVRENIPTNSNIVYNPVRMPNSHLFKQVKHSGNGRDKSTPMGKDILHLSPEITVTVFKNQNANHANEKVDIQNQKKTVTKNTVALKGTPTKSLGNDLKPKGDGCTKTLYEPKMTKSIDTKQKVNNDNITAKPNPHSTNQEQKDTLVSHNISLTRVANEEQKHEKTVAKMCTSLKKSTEKINVNKENGVAITSYGKNNEEQEKDSVVVTLNTDAIPEEQYKSSNLQCSMQEDQDNDLSVTVEANESQLLLENNVAGTEDKASSRSALQSMEQEFHPTYKKFIDTCFKFDNSKDMQRIYEIKIKKYYKQCPQEYVESYDFIRLVSGRIDAIERNPKEMFIFIKDVVDELNLQRNLESIVNQSKEDNVAKDSIHNSESDRKLLKLRKFQLKLNDTIKKYEEREVDLYDEENSAFLIAERLKKRFLEVHEAICELSNERLPREARVVVEGRAGRPQGPARRLQRLVNRRVPLGPAPVRGRRARRTINPFPDYEDVLGCVRAANDEDGLGWTYAEIEAEARYLFEKCGQLLKMRRQLRDRKITIDYRMGDGEDPADLDEDLRRKLQENRRIALQRESDVINEFAAKQESNARRTPQENEPECDSDESSSSSTIEQVKQ